MVAKLELEPLIGLLHEYSQLDEAERELWMEIHLNYQCLEGDAPVDFGEDMLDFEEKLGGWLRRAGCHDGFLGRVRSALYPHLRCMQDQPSAKAMIDMLGILKKWYEIHGRAQEEDRQEEDEEALNKELQHLLRQNKYYAEAFGE